METEALADTAYQLQLLLKVDGTNLEFHATETLLQFLLQALQHLVVVAHPHEAVDGYAHLAARESSIEKQTSSFFLLTSYIQKCRLESEEHRGIVAHRLVVYLSRPFHLVAESPQHFAVVRMGITAEVR